MAIYQGNKKLAYSCNVDNSVYAVPIGTILSYASATLPVGFLVCDGSEVSKTTYSDLYSVIGDLYGECTDTSKFKLPDLRDKFVQGANGNLGTSKDAGLPDLSGQVGYIKSIGDGSYWQGINMNTGVFKSSQQTVKTSPTATTAAESTSHSQPPSTVVFKASDSNSIYGNSDTVQPPSVCLTFIIKALKVSDKYAEEVGALIDDTTIATDKVWSSQKISNSLIAKADKSKVADVNWTSVDISTVDENTSIKATLNYCIKNGICYMSILNIGFKTTTASEVIILGANSVPKPSSDYCWYPLVGISDPSYSVLVHPNVSGGLEHHVVGLISQVYSGSFSYPVAES